MTSATATLEDSDRGALIDALNWLATATPKLCRSTQLGCTR